MLRETFRRRLLLPFQTSIARNMKITFLGATGEVTGSRYLVEHKATKLLVDCGMFQGRESAERNLEPFPIDPKSIDALVLTHAHIDHTGYIPALVKHGFKGPIYCSEGTYALCTLLLKDSGFLQEQAARNTQVGGPDHPPTVALYTVRDAEDALKLFKPTAYDQIIQIGDALQVTLLRSGHILGSSFVLVSDGDHRLTFTGDLGRPHQFVMKSPPPLMHTDFLVVESTYGDRLHLNSETNMTDTIQKIGEIVKATVAKGGILVIPCFAVGRTEEILYCLYQLQQAHAIPQIPIFLDSPMAIKIADFFCDYKDEYSMLPNVCRDIFSIATKTTTIEESKRLNQITHRAIVIAGSGMADGGRVPFHLQHVIADPKNTVLFVGFQVQGTHGYALTHGAKTIMLNGNRYPVRADIQMIGTLSAHADSNEIVAWLAHFKEKPKKVFVTHGEMEASQALKKRIEKHFGWPVIVPNYLESFELD